MTDMTNYAHPILNGLSYSNDLNKPFELLFKLLTGKIRRRHHAAVDHQRMTVDKI